MKILLLLCSLISFAQTRPVPSQVPWFQTDESFYRQCFSVNPTDNTVGPFAYAYFPNETHPHGLVSSSQIPSTYLRMSQVSGYGVSVSADGTQMLIQNWGGTWVITATNATATGTIEYRVGMSTPNMNLIGLQSTDVTMMPYGWAMMLNAGYTVPPLASVSLLNGIFTLVPSSTVFRNTCELLGGGPYPDIIPWSFPPIPVRTP